MNSQHNISIINAGAGSGKTYKIAERVLEYVNNGIPVSQIMLTTFTKKAARELRERIKKTLIENNEFEESQKVDDAWFGTVHSLGKRLIDVFTFEAGYAPNQEVVPEDDEDMLFRQAMAVALKPEDYRELNQLADELQVINWQDDVLEIIKKARENNIDLVHYSILSASSIKTFTDTLGASLKKNDIKTIADAYKLLSSVKDLLPGIKNKRLKAHNNLLPFIETLKNPEKDRYRLYELFLKELKTAEALDAADPEDRAVYDAIITMYRKCYNFFFRNQFAVDFEEAYGEYVKRIFETAYEVYNAYVNFKKERGLVDYSDQENVFLSLLDKEPVKKYIESQFKLLMVDEFQDTNPMQLAIFMKLSSLIPETVFVGDPKQSIYGFRGTDLYLINKISCSDKVKREETLDTSRRSREPLVHFSNMIFSRLFKDLREEDIILKPWDKLAEADSFGASLQYWNASDAKNIGEQQKRVVQKLENMMSGERPVIRDKETKQIRKIEYGDMAILCRSNAEVRAWATLLEQYGIEVSAEREEFQMQAEIVFLLSACSYLVNKTDTLAIAELLVLGDDEYAGNPGKLIDERIEWLQKEQEGFLKENSIITGRLDAIEFDAEAPGIYGLIEKGIAVTDIYNLTARWRKASVRRANIQKFLGLAEKYEQRCISYNIAISLHGFIKWIKAQEELKQSPSLSRNAVKVMTYHDAKGLEWPVVILAGLRSELREKWHGTFVMSSGNEFDIYNPLTDREVVHMHNPFGFSWSNGKNDYNNPPGHILTQLQTSAIYKQSVEGETGENTRLMYVAITRARDYLIIPTPRDLKGTSWWTYTAARVIPDFMNATNDYSIEAEKNIPVSVHILPPESEITVRTDHPEYFFTDAKGRKEFMPFRVSPSMFIDESGADAIHASIEIRDDLSTGRLCGGLNEIDLGEALHNVFAIWDEETAKEKRLEIIKNIIEGYGMNKDINAEPIDTICLKFFDWIKIKFPGSRIYRELPLSHYSGEQLTHGYADLLIEHNNDLVLVDYKSYQGSDLKEHARKYAGQLQAYKTIIEAAHPQGSKVMSTLIFYPVTGIVVDLKLNPEN